MADEKTYQLKDKTTSFYDDTTGLTVTRDEKVKVDMSGGAGRKTLLMIKRGGLIEVKGPPAPPSGAGAGDAKGGGALAPDFPSREKLAAAGYTTPASLKGVTAEELTKKGLTKAEAEEVAARLK